MEALQRFLAIMHADLRERTRTPRFWTVLALMAAATWYCFPSADDGYNTLTLVDGSRGLYGSGWIGMSLGLILSSILLNIIGFYLVRGTLTRDIETRVWQLLVTTPMTRGGYLLAKWASHMAVFGMIAAVGVVVALIAQWVRAEDRHIDLIELIKPLLLLSLPSLALTAMFAIWFDLVPWLRRTAGNILFFFLWSTILALSVASGEDKPGTTQQGWTSDPSGMMVAAREFRRVRQEQTGKSLSLGFNLGSPRTAKNSKQFEWPEWKPSAKLVSSRAMWLVLAMLLTLLAAPLLDWAASRGLSKEKARSGAGRSMRWADWILDPFARGSLGILAVAELKQALRQRRIWWWLAALGLMGAQFGTQEAMQNGLLLAWLLPLDVVSRGMLRESEFRTKALMFTAPDILSRLLAARFLVGFSMLMALSLPTIFRLASNDPVSAIAVVTSIISITSWGLCLGALCRNARPFELLMVGTVYACLNGATVFSAASHPIATVTTHAIGLIPAWVLLVWAWPRLARH